MTPANGSDRGTSPPKERSHIVLSGIGKRFGGVVALEGIDLVIERATIHSLVGENGAGKSTLGKLLAGIHVPDAGTVSVDGSPVRYKSPREALSDGITSIAQELMLVPKRSVLENVYLGNDTARYGVVQVARMRLQYAALCERAGFELPADTLVGTLRLADQQKVEILRALARQARVIVMDEPTAALNGRDAELLLRTMSALRDGGTTIVFVSHFLDQVLAVSDKITVLRDGELVRSTVPEIETVESLVVSMLGRSMGYAFEGSKPPPDSAPIVLSVRNLTRTGVIEDINLDVRAGEVLGLAGLVGAGRTEVARAIFGADPRNSGEIMIDGVKLRIRSPRDAVKAGIAMVPESRKDQGLLMKRSVLGNVSLAYLEEVSRLGVLVSKVESCRVGEITSRVGVKTSSLKAPVATLSGGNQQKTMFAKWLLGAPRLLIADEPTRGVDVGAKRAIYDLLAELAKNGMAVLLISSEIEEVLMLSHRVLVMRQGRIVAEFVGDDLKEHKVLNAAFSSSEVAA